MKMDFIYKHLAIDSLKWSCFELMIGTTHNMPSEEVVVVDQLRDFEVSGHRQ